VPASRAATQAGLKDLVFRFWTGIHRAIFRATGGRVGGTGFGMPVLELATVGRRTGRPRRTMLTAPIVEGERLVLVASYGGDDRHPAWFLNLRANPDCEVTMRGRTRAMRARVASPEERAALWPRVTRAYRGYALYQRRTRREIPLVILEPRGDAPAARGRSSDGRRVRPEGFEPPTF
jgi:deazaflavin-dependent oxidoreductase (nitroreductase family)